MNFIELSKESLWGFRESLGSADTERYVYTLYVAISEKNEVTCAHDSSVLDGAYQCILIHCKSALAVTNWNNWYKLEFINHNGHNLGGIIGNDCTIKIDGEGSWSNQVMKLRHRNEVLYSCNAPFENHMQAIWDAYRNTLNGGNDEITLLRDELAQKEERIHALEEQVNQYQNIIERIRESINILGE